MSFWTHHECVTKTNWNLVPWAVPEKKQTGEGGLRIIFCEETPGIFGFLSLPLKLISNKTKLDNPGNSTKLC